MTIITKGPEIRWRIKEVLKKLFPLISRSLPSSGSRHSFEALERTAREAE